MKHTNKLWLTLLLMLLVAVLAAAGMTAAAAETPTVIDQGYCGGEGDGTNLTWTLDSEGTLTVSGEGMMAPTLIDDQYTHWDAATQSWKTEIIDRATEQYPWNEWQESELGIYNMNVKKIVISEGVTAIYGTAFSQFNPETIVLPASLTAIPKSYILPQRDNVMHIITSIVNPDNLRHVYMLNPDAAVDQFALTLPGWAGETLPASTYEDFIAHQNDLLEEYLSVFPAYGILYESIDVLEKIYGMQQDAFVYEMVYGTHEGDIKREFVVTDAGKPAFLEGYIARSQDLWDYIGLEYEDTDTFTSALLNYMNNQWKTSFVSLEDLFDLGEPEQEGGKPSIVYSDVLNTLLDLLESELSSVAEFRNNQGSYQIGQPPLAKNGNTESPLLPMPWLTIHGYAGSTAEAVAAASGVKFAPLCPTDYSHSVVETAAVKATAFDFGCTAGWYCESCGAYLAGRELIMPTSFHGTADDFVAITLDEPFEITLEERTQSPEDYLKIYTFTPSETTQYTILGENAYANYLMIYDSDLNLVASAPSNVADLEYYIYSFTTELTADKTYYFFIRCMNNASDKPAVRTYTLTTQPPHGTFGDGFSWILEDHTLTISGEGPMPDFSDHSPPVPWRDYFVNGIDKNNVVLKEGVTRIGKNTIPSWSLFSGVGLKELTVLNPACDLSELRSCEPAILRGYPGSTAQSFVPAYEDIFHFIPLCPVDYTHTVTEKAEAAAACTAAGHTAGWYCEDCGAYLTGIEIAPLNHANAQPAAETKPTAFAHGFTAGVYCSDCDTWLSGHNVIHNQLGARTVVKEATETEEGEVIINCTVCGESGLYAPEKLPHTDPQPEQPTNSNSSNGGEDISFFARLRKAARGIIEVFLRLIRWLGGKK